MRQSFAVVAVVMAIAATQGACDSGQDAPSPSDVSYDSGGTSGDTGADGDATQGTGVMPAVPELPGAKGAVTDATFGDCGTGEGRHTVVGTLENSTGQDMQYVVAVSWLDSDAVVVGRGVAQVEDVGSGRTVQFDVEADVPDGATSCSFYVLRAPAA